jgi:hypothetical protein
MWLVKETDAGKSGPTMELYEEQQKKNKESVGPRSDAQQVSYCKERVLAFI